MLRDRIVLMDKHLQQLMRDGGQLYLKIILGQATPEEIASYDDLKAKIADAVADIAIVEQMIDDGHV